MEEIKVTSFIDPKAIKRIGVTCKCGFRAVHEVVEGPGMIPIIECEKCGQKYAFGGVGKPLVRLDKNYQPEAKVMEQSQTGPTLEGVWTQSESKMVN